MKKLPVIESELVPVYETSSGEKVVYGTELFQILQSRRQYTDWIKDRFKECDAVENVDYESFSQKNEKPKGGRPAMEYIIKLDTAKEMAMLERNEKGKQVRRYFIQVEKRYQKGITKKQTGNEKLHVMEMNARSRMAQMYLKIGQVDTLSPTYKTVMAAKASEVLSGEQLISLPKVEEKTYSADEIGKQLGISANKVGRLANKNGLKTEEYGSYFRDTKKHSSGECDTWRYYSTVIPALETILGEQKVGGNI